MGQSIGRTGALAELDAIGGVGPIPQLPQQVPQQSWGQQNANKLMALGGIIGGMAHRPNQAVQRLGQYGLQMEQVKKQGNATVAHLRQRGHDDLAQLVESNPTMAREALKQSYERDKPQETYSQISGEPFGVKGAVNRNDLTGKVSTIGGAGTQINLPEQQLAPPKDHRWVRDAAGRIVSAEVIPGTATYRELQAEADKGAARQDTTATAASTVVQDMQRALDLFPEFAVEQDADSGYLGRVFGSTSRAVLSSVPGTPEYQAKQFFESAASNIGIDQLKQMREQSPTGGALGQVPFQQQKRLEQLLGSVEISQNTPELEDNTKRIINVYLEAIHGTRRERLKLLSEGKITQAAFDEVESLFKPLSFDKVGKKIDTKNPPPDFPEDKRALWERLPDEAKLMAWSRYRNRDGY